MGASQLSDAPGPQRYGRGGRSLELLQAGAGEARLRLRLESETDALNSTRAC